MVSSSRELDNCADASQISASQDITMGNIVSVERESQRPFSEAVSSASSLSDIDDEETDEFRHTIFKPIKIHTAKCDVCNLHNKCTLRRCIDCGWQICTPCWIVRGGNGTHGVSRKFNGPVFDPNAPASNEREHGKRASDKTSRSFFEEVDPAVSKSKVKIKDQENKSAIPTREHNTNLSGYRVPTKGKARDKVNDIKTNQRRQVEKQPAQKLPLAKQKRNNVNKSNASYRVPRNGNAMRDSREMSPDDPNNPMFWLCVAAQEVLDQAEEEVVDTQELQREDLPLLSQGVSNTPTWTAINRPTVRSPLFVPMDIADQNNQQAFSRHPFYQHGVVPRHPNIPPNIFLRYQSRLTRRAGLESIDAGIGRRAIPASQIPTANPEWVLTENGSCRLIQPPSQSAYSNAYIGQMWDEPHETFSSDVQFPDYPPLNNEVPDGRAQCSTRGRPWDL
ncbi:hypothetical protein LOZ66_001493 [Ophidiomyces ophidiicola]|nr:hypothetical protein LOZ66_001493 [Ophidiomyces ophidiicola]